MKQEHYKTMLVLQDLLPPLLLATGSTDRVKSQHNQTEEEGLLREERDDKPKLLQVLAKKNGRNWGSIKERILRAQDQGRRNIRIRESLLIWGHSAMIHKLTLC